MLVETAPVSTPAHVPLTMSSMDTDAYVPRDTLVKGVLREERAVIQVIILKLHGLVVQSFLNLTCLLMTNSLTVIAKVFSNTLVFLLQKCE